MDRQYFKLGFDDVFEDGVLIPIPWSGDIPSRTLALNTIAAESQWRAASHPLYKFMIDDFTPDIQIFSSVSGAWSRPRTDDQRPPSQDTLDEIFGMTVI
jgi:hypothetical protein